jgi:hypothetical protein
MRIEIILLLLTAGLIYNVYTDGKYLKLLLSYKKYYQMAGIAFAGLALMWLLRKNPQKANDMIATSNEYLKYLPIDSNTSNILSPILDFTSKQNFSQESRGGGGILNMFLPSQSPPTKLMNSGANGGKATKRSVSETKKKFVASRQNWTCNDCKEQLTAWYEVDHVVRLEYGGSNHIDNLVALCRDCHGRKTTIENL